MCIRDSGGGAHQLGETVPTDDGQDRRGGHGGPHPVPALGRHFLGARVRGHVLRQGRDLQLLSLIHISEPTRPY